MSLESPGKDSEKEKALEEFAAMQEEMRVAARGEKDVMKRLEIQRDLYAAWGLKLQLEESGSLGELRLRLKKDLEEKEKGAGRQKEQSPDYIRRELSFLDRLEKRL